MVGYLLMTAFLISCFVFPVQLRQIRVFNHGNFVRNLDLEIDLKQISSVILRPKICSIMPFEELKCGVHSNSSGIDGGGERDMLETAEQTVASAPSKERLMTIKIFSVVDYSIFKKFVYESSAHSRIEKLEEAKIRILDYYNCSMERMKHIYENIKMDGLKFTTKWVGAFIAESPQDVPFIGDSMIAHHTVNDSKVLGKLKEWTDRKRAEGYVFPSYDVLLVFTSYSMTKGNFLERHSGMAYLGTICTSLGFGIVRYDDFLYDTEVIAHELGHSLGMNHDGDRNDCNPGVSKIMTTGYEKISLWPPWYNLPSFSECSLSYLRKTIDRLDDSANNCMEHTGVDYQLVRKGNLSNLYPSQIHDFDQCRMFHDSTRYIIILILLSISALCAICIFISMVGFIAMFLRRMCKRSTYEQISERNKD